MNGACKKLGHDWVWGRVIRDERKQLVQQCECRRCSTEGVRPWRQPEYEQTIADTRERNELKAAWAK